MPATTPEALARKAERNRLRMKAQRDAQRASGNAPTQSCRACAAVSARGYRGDLLHSCADFPLPQWATDYLAQWSPDLMPAQRDAVRRELHSGILSALPQGGSVEAGWSA